MNKYFKIDDPTIVTISREYSASAELAFDAWLDAENAGKWLFATPDGEMKRVEIDAQVGGKFRFDELRGDELVEHTGEYLEIDRPNKLAFSFDDTNLNSRSIVIIEIVPTEIGCRLTLTHEFGQELVNYLDDLKMGWGHIVNNIAPFIE